VRTFVLSVTASIICGIVNHYQTKFFEWLDKQWGRRQVKRRRPNRRKR